MFYKILKVLPFTETQKCGLECWNCFNTIVLGLLQYFVLLQYDALVKDLDLVHHFGDFFNFKTLLYSSLGPLTLSLDPLIYLNFQIL